jgi:hypothetical protein
MLSVTSYGDSLRRAAAGDPPGAAGVPRAAVRFHHDACQLLRGGPGAPSGERGRSPQGGV